MSLLLKCCGLGAQRTRHLFLTGSISKIVHTQGKIGLGNGRPAASLLVLVLVLALATKAADLNALLIVCMRGPFVDRDIECTMCWALKEMWVRVA